MIPTLQLAQMGRQVIGVASLPLDDYQTNLWAACAISKLLSNFAGSAIRVRRSSDNAEQDIGFSGTALDTTALSTFVGANSAYVVTWYDQSGLGNNFTQATQANQPRIVNAGVYDANLVFDGTNDGLSSVNASGSRNAITALFRSNLRSTASTQILFEQSTDFGANLDSVALYYDSGSSRTTAYINRSGTDNSNLYTEVPTAGVFGCVWEPDQATAANKVRVYRGGSLLTPASSPAAGTSTANLANYTYYFGARNGGASLPAALDCSSLVVYFDGKSAADVAAISAAI